MKTTQVIPAAAAQQSILANLLELYAHDFSDFLELELGPDGLFGYKALPLYWREPERHPFLIYADGQLAGLVLVKREADQWDMAEFFVVRGHRKRGVGFEAAHAIWRLFPGTWEVRVLELNQVACRFWRRAIEDFVGAEVPFEREETSGRRWRVFRFEAS